MKTEIETFPNESQVKDRLRAEGYHVQGSGLNGGVPFVTLEDQNGKAFDIEFPANAEAREVCHG